MLVITAKFFIKTILIASLIISTIVLSFRTGEINYSSLIRQQNILAQANPKIFKPAEQKWVSIDKISNSIVLAAISSEDQTFISHYGFDFKQIKISIDNFNHGQKLRGASTISQQTVKNLFLWHQRSVTRKILEFIIVPFVELLWSKKRIMEVYLNIVQFGKVTYGVELASQKYFGKSAQDINDDEAAWLISSLTAPARFNIVGPSKKLIQRQMKIYQQIKYIRWYLKQNKLKL